MSIREEWWCLYSLKRKSSNAILNIAYVILNWSNVENAKHFKVKNNKQLIATGKAETFWTDAIGYVVNSGFSSK